METKRGSFPGVPARANARPIRAAVSAASVSRSQATSRWSDTNPVGQMTTALAPSAATVRISHVKLAMAFQTRYSPRYRRIKQLIAEGAIGEVLEVRTRGKEDRRGGGEDLMVLGVHLLDLCRDLLGEPSWCFARVSERYRETKNA